MKTSPRLALPYAEAGDDMRDYPTVVDLPNVTRHETVWFPGGWTALTPVGSGTLRYRVIGSIVFVDVVVTTTFTPGTQVVITAVPVPAAVRPLEDWKAMGQFQDQIGYVWIDTTGAIKARHWAAANKSSVSASLIYPLT